MPSKFVTQRYSFMNMNRILKRFHDIEWSVKHSAFRTGSFVIGMCTAA